ncbi:MAG TPA: putative lipopolysaccharide heptosyltransferase III [Gammaproteobacteria bacterium]|nr:putative lipopolysaccharide heptosyltransferase III [Gammaproteobacteria bacterium]
MQESYLVDAIDLTLVRRVLVIKLRHYGDVLLTSPVFSILAKAIPDVEIDALVYADTSPMLELHPSISQLHCIDRKWKKQGVKSQWLHERQLVQVLCSRQYDLVIHLTEHARGARLVRRLKPRYAVAQSYPGKRGHWWRDSFTHTYRIPAKPRHTVEIHLDALRRLGIYPAIEDRRLVLTPGPDADKKASKLMQEHGLKKGNYLLLHPTSRWMFKGWSRRGFAEVLQQLHGNGYRLVLTSAPDPAEMGVIKQIISDIVELPIVNLAGTLSLKELSALIDHASCFIGLDSVPMHIAAAMNTPCVALFGPSNEKIWGPWQVKHALLAKEYSCRPCGLDGCGNGKISDCLMAINAEEVVSAVEEMLS